jgi:hypothetical protein
MRLESIPSRAGLRFGLLSATAFEPIWPHSRHKNGARTAGSKCRRSGSRQLCGVRQGRVGAIGIVIYFAIKAALSGLIVAAVSEIARRSPGVGALVASLPLISILGMMWLWRDTADPLRLANHAEATFWYVLPSLPMFLLIPMLLRNGVGFWTSLIAGCVLTIALYLAMTVIGPRFGVKL